MRIGFNIFYIKLKKIKVAINASDSTSGINICANLCSDALTSNLGFITF